MESLLLRIFRRWLPFAVIISVLCFVIYFVIQQDIRQGANDPQIQIAEDTARLLDSGKTPAENNEIDISGSLAPFTIAYDLQGNVVSSQAILNGKTPNLPKGVLEFSKDIEEKRITWQPRKDVRIAAVIVKYSRGYVLAGRNIREIETRESAQIINVFLGLVISLLASFSAIVLTEILFIKVTSQKN